MVYEVVNDRNMILNPDISYASFLPLLTLPCFAAIIWAVREKLQYGNRKEALCLATVGADVMLFGLITYARVCLYELPVVVYLLQSVMLDVIVPITYMYFSHQMGRKWANHTTLLLWALMLLLLLPNCTIFMPGSTMQLSVADIPMFSLNVVYGADGIYTIYMADVVILMQTLLTLNRMYSLVSVVHRYGLMLNPHLKAFGIWWLMAAIFILMMAIMEDDSIFSTFNCWIFFICLSVLVVSIFVLLALHFDLSPIILPQNETLDEEESNVAGERKEHDETDASQMMQQKPREPLPKMQHQEVIHIDSFVQKSSEMAVKLTTVMDREKLYLNPEFNVDEALNILGTNRTYFFKMMTAEFGMKFTDYISVKRVNHAKQLLETTGKSMLEVALESGFSDASYFGRKFKEITGTTPVLWRKDAQKQ